ncbi:ketoacyl-ACP synthase III [Chitinimonas lacunae]|uniref:Ketoacyl-ACP synthase III n=1 Tax=Chitinimonas lacunae TaxID=1963018 RepID=A0ABV8MT30_9NEIS
MSRHKSQSGLALSLQGARITGVVSALPPRRVDNSHFSAIFGEDVVRDVVKMIGVEQRYWTDAATTTADLCERAARRLMEALAWSADEVDALILVSQTPDYALPASACVLHGRLGLAPACLAFDVNLGCSGYTYGLWLAHSMIASGSAARVLLLAGDTISKTVAPEDRATAMLFGDAGTATAIEADPQGKASYILGTDGQGASSLIMPDSAWRRSEAPAREAALQMDGGAVFNFTLQAVPPLVAESLALAQTSVEQVDYFLFHQANLFMLRHLAKKAKLPADKCPTNIAAYGNTSSASIPLLMTTTLATPLRERRQRLALFGFGVGFSWGSAVFDTGPLACVETL